MKNLKFSIYGSRNVKISIIKWKGKELCSDVIKDGNGNEYFAVPNYLSKGDNELSDLGFEDKIKDMIDTIKNGDGDDIYIKETPSDYKYYILYYLNRNVGERYRSRLLKRFRGAEFKYAVYTPDSEGLVYTEDGYFEVMTDPQYNKKIKVFNSEEEAENAIFEINKTDECSMYSNLKAIQIVRV